MSGIHGAIQNKNTWLWNNNSNEEMDDIIKIVQALENSNILLKRVTKTIKNGINKQDGKGIGMLLGTLGASLLGNLLTGKGLYRSGKGFYRSGKGLFRSGQGIYRAGQGIYRAGEGLYRSGEGI